MIDKLKDNEKTIATNLIKDGLDNASGALQMILNSPISIKKIEFGIDVLKENKRFDEDSSMKFHVLRTELMGELEGVCHLIFTDEEVEKINLACLPQDLAEKAPEEYNLLRHGFITEIDNMVSAAVITQFSNFLNMSMYGNVPSLHIMPAKEVTEYLDMEASKFAAVVHFKAMFEGEELNISPDFTWMVHEKFLSKIKELA
ncbi:MAG: hypothetical protein JXR07_17020 [Reichenbachiella sp.]